MDQDSLLVYGMTAVLEAQQEKEERESKVKKTR